jgi:aspartate/methionine/tyrosine aminotransferase
LQGALPVPIVTKEEENFKLSAKALKEAITPKNKAFDTPEPE